MSLRPGWATSRISSIIVKSLSQKAKETRFLKNNEISRSVHSFEKKFTKNPFATNSKMCHQEGDMRWRLAVNSQAAGVGDKQEALLLGFPLNQLF